MDPFFQRSSAHFIHLDMLRGLAALAVVAGHVRGFLFVDYSTLQSSNIAEKTAYFLCSLGHDAVIAFFALSGFLVGGKALRDIQAGTWSFPAYMVARLARLWTVVIPALCITFLLDFSGKHLAGGAGYDGSYWPLLSSGPSPDVGADDSLITMLANIAFLQTIAAPVFGTNGPLWSLANEFWYYIIFPLAAYVTSPSQNRQSKIAAALTSGTLALLLPLQLVLLGAIWVAGALVYKLSTAPTIRRVFCHPIYVVASLALWAAGMAHGASSHGTLVDLGRGLAWALVVGALAAMPSWGGLYEQIARSLSNVSYTLYATHFPLLAFAWFTLLAPAQSRPDLMTLLKGAALMCLTVMFATVMWWCFERNTQRIRGKVLLLLGLARPSTAVAVSAEPQNP